MGCMKDLNLLVWLTQLGLSVAIPLAGFVFLGFWLHQGCGWGKWAVWAGLILGLICAIQAFRDSLKILARMSGDRKKEDPGVSFNEHN